MSFIVGKEEGDTQDENDANQASETLHAESTDNVGVKDSVGT
jgi:hypothetical protein